MTKPDDQTGEYEKIQYTGENHVAVCNFANRDGLKNWDDHSLTLFNGESTITIGRGDYLFKDRDGKLVTVNPA